MHKVALKSTGQIISTYSRKKAWDGRPVQTQIGYVDNLEWPGCGDFKVLLCNCNDYTVGNPCFHVMRAVQEQRIADEMFDDDELKNALKAMLDESGPQPRIALQTGYEGVMIPVVADGGSEIIQFRIVTDYEPDPVIISMVDLMEPLSEFDNLRNLHVAVGDTLSLWARGMLSEPFRSCKSGFHRTAHMAGTKSPAPHTNPDAYMAAPSQSFAYGWGRYHPKLVADWYMLLAHQICIECLADLPSTFDDGMKGIIQ